MSGCFANDSIFLALANAGDACSGHGQCIDNVCVCDALWTGASDFVRVLLYMYKPRRRAFKANALPMIRLP